MNKGKRKALTIPPTKANVKGTTIDNIRLFFCPNYTRKCWERTEMRKRTRRILFIFALLVIVSAIPVYLKVILAGNAITILALDFDEFNYQTKIGGTK